LTVLLRCSLQTEETQPARSQGEGRFNLDLHIG